MYPNGYSVAVRSRKVKKVDDKQKNAANTASSVWVEVNVKGKGKEVAGEMYLRLGGTPKAGNELKKPTVGSTETPVGATGEQTAVDAFLPLIYSLHTMPASPMHSSSLNAEAGAARHLLRMSIPTAQYQVSSVMDPLTGEIRTGPKKPTWLRVLEGLDEEEGPEAVPEKPGEPLPEDLDEVPTVASHERGRFHGALVEIEIRPLLDGSDKDKNKSRVKKVEVNGIEVPVIGEKESLTNLGRDVLLDDRIGKMPILFRLVYFIFIRRTVC